MQFSPDNFYLYDMDPLQSENAAACPSARKCRTPTIISHQDYKMRKKNHGKSSKNRNFASSSKKLSASDIFGHMQACELYQVEVAGEGLLMVQPACGTGKDGLTRQIPHW